MTDGLPCGNNSGMQKKRVKGPKQNRALGVINLNKGTVESSETVIALNSLSSSITLNSPELYPISPFIFSSIS
jgi:hypothetical protein